MSFQDQVSEVSQKIAESAKVKAQELWEHTKTKARLHAKLEWRRTQHRVFRKIRDAYEPPVIPVWIQRKIDKTDTEESIELPFKRDAEPFLVVPLRLARRMEIQQGWLSGKVNGREVRFILPEDFKQTLLDFHDPTVDIELEEMEREAALAKLPEKSDEGSEA